MRGSPSSGGFGCRSRGRLSLDSLRQKPGARDALETRILDAVESQVLIPENVAYVAERALELVRQRVARTDPAADRARLEEIADELANLVRLAAKVGHLDAHARVLHELEAEKLEIEGRLSLTPEPLDLASVRREIEVMVRDLRSLLEGGDGRAVLKRLLGSERLRVRPDDERGFAVEGELSWIVGTACGDSVVAGTGFEPVTFGL